MSNPFARAKKAIADFVVGQTAEVLCVFGPWGSGKSHALKMLFENEVYAEKAAFDSYSLVSLFGVADATEALRLAYVSSRPFGPREDELLTPVGVFMKNKITSLTQAASGLVRQASIPHVANVGPLIDAAISRYFGKCIVCFDDIERRDPKFDLRSLLGLALKLKENNECKVILILNIDALAETDRDNFDLYLEKVIDLKIKLEISAIEAADIAIVEEAHDDGFVRNIVKSSCAELDITNIRVIRKIYHFAVTFRDISNRKDDEILRRALRSLVFIAWSILDKPAAPSISFVERFNRADYGKREKSIDELRWEAIARAYNFSSIDNLDRAVIAGIQSGFFNNDVVCEEFASIDRNVEGKKASAIASSIWNRFYDRFDQNEERLASEIIEETKSHLDILYPRDFDSIIALLKTLGCRDSALELLRDYMHVHQDEPAKFAFIGGIQPQDPDAQAAFAEAYAKYQPPLMSLAEAAAAMRVHRGMRDEELASIQSLTREQIYNSIKAARGEELRSIMYALSFIISVGSIDDRYNKMKQDIRSIFDEIEAENQFNKRLIGLLARN